MAMRKTAVNKRPAKKAQAAPREPSRSSFSWEGTVEISSVGIIGRVETCRAWCDQMLRRDVYILDANGKPHVVGHISGTTIKCLGRVGDTGPVTVAAMSDTNTAAQEYAKSLKLAEGRGFEPLMRAQPA